MKGKAACLDFALGGNKILNLIALFEESFSIDWIVELTQAKPSEILSQLNEATRQGFLAAEESGYFSFKNREIQQLLKDRMSLEEKEWLNRDIAQVYMRELPDEQRRNQRVACHLLQIFNDMNGCDWLLKTGDSYLSEFRYEDALQCYTKVLDDVRGISGEKADTLFITAAIKYSKISTARHKTTKTRSILEAAMVRADRWNKKDFHALLEMHMAKNEWLRSRFDSAMRCFESGWSKAKKAEDPQIVRAAATFSTFFLYWQGRFQEAIQHYEKAVPDLDKYPRGRFPLFAALTVAYCYARIGQVTQGLGMLDTMYTHCVEKGDLFLAANVSSAIGNIMIDIRRQDVAVQYLERALEEAKQANNRWVLINANLILAFAHYLRGENKLSITHLRQFMHNSNQAQMTVRTYPQLMELCCAMEQGTLPHISGLSLENEINQAIKGPNIFLKGVAYRQKALLQRREGIPHEKVIRSLKQSLRWLEESGHHIEKTRSLLELAQQYSLCGEGKKAKEASQVAIDILTRFNEDLIPEDLRPLLNNLSSTKNLIKEHLRLGREAVLIKDNSELLRYIIFTLNRIMGAERGAIFILEEDTCPARLKLRASINLTSEQIDHPSFTASTSMKMIEEATATGKIRISEMSSTQGSETNFINIGRSCICIPMILWGKVIGVLYHDNRLLSNMFEDPDHEILQHYATIAAFSVHNDQLHEKLQRLTQISAEEKKYYEQQYINNFHFEEIVGQSLGIMDVLTKIEHVASSDTTVLIYGETGVGKELVARAIYNNSSRRKKPYIQVNCSSLPENLFPTELFGHEKGAFTGAINRRIGRFELADGGTLFLDEIGTLPSEMQIHLLRVLQTKRFERIGGNETLHSDFRLITATNHDLHEEVKAHRFRSDLYYRLNVFPIYVPPLRERKEDIPPLAYHFLEALSTKTGKTFEGIREADMERMIQYNWPGNVRELQNIIERGIILSSGSYFQVPELISNRPTSLALQDAVTLRDNERSHILWALQRTKWKIRGPGGAAELLDIHPSTLRFRMNKLGIQRPNSVSN